LSSFFLLPVLFDIGDHRKPSITRQPNFLKTFELGKRRRQESGGSCFMKKAEPKAKNLVTLYILFQVVQEYERAVIFRLGRLRKVIRLKI